MSYPPAPGRSAVANAVYGLLNPIPFGFFVAALVFDIVYAKTGTILWAKGAAWLIVIGLLFAVIPRLLNLVQVWITSRRFSTGADHVDFWLNVVAIVAAILNAFVHSRDAYAIMPAGVWLSVVTVTLIAAGHVVIAVRYSTAREILHD
ncbi:DUF2231 domain-containing protein [Luteibacter yeojuensis]|uniref:DUF2231 domain-containing protein n=1 Tax=Luteibacter yeojuensis TaxID=345309 RepID=A0A7X5QUF6_9GAMM|nr:DUF2231 domain-containing protein [Luteibacter yeojuensis]NID15625.1 hypothetical protein [Luteibacter yeojuensis]